MLNQQFFKLILLLILSTSIFHVEPARAALYGSVFSAALFYASNPPFDELAAFDAVVVDPDAAGVSAAASRAPKSSLFAYVSLGEADPARKNFRQFNPSWFMGDNRAWNSRVVDVSNPAWRRFFLDEVIEPLWKSGYRGFFLDTLDSYQMVTKKDGFSRMETAIAEVILEIKRRHPETRLILNRGFDVFERVKGAVFAVAAESLYRNFDPSTGRYGEVKKSDRAWLKGKLADIRNAGKPVIVIDYLPPSERELARKTAERIKKDGFIPWITDKDISSLGVGSIEVIPRKILGLYDGSEGPDPVYSNIQRFAVMPLNYLGYQVELHDMRKALPDGILRGRYSGVMLWPNSETSGDRSGLLKWLLKQRDDGLPLLFMDRFGISPQQFAKQMGGTYKTIPTPKATIRVAMSEGVKGFEIEPQANRWQILPLQFANSRPLISLTTDTGVVADAVAITPWGGYALEPFVVNESLDERARWIVDPFRLMKEALRLPELPLPDTTTENGVRLLLLHIDADGFESRVERPDAPLAVTELRERILKKYRLPTTCSVITSTLGDRGVKSKNVTLYQSEARELFRLPWVEAGSHTFSHPFYWKESEVTKRDYKELQYLAIPGYRFSLEAEIPGSIRFIEKNLLPAGKKVKLIQWSGNCVPGADAIEMAYRSGVGNINGGDTKITESNRSVTAVAPLGVFKNGWFQVFAPNQNENVYTNDWTGPFYGYRRVIETFRLTDTPRRLKPINMYYHTYSVTKEASRRALEDVYDWVLSQKPNPVFTSEYVNKVLDFNNTVVARAGNGWLIRNRGFLREFRVPISAGYPDLLKSRGVVGYSDHNDQRYIHLAPGSEAYIELTKTPPSLPYVSSLQGVLKSFERTARGLRLGLVSWIPGELKFGSASGCRVVATKGVGKPLDSGRKISLRAQAGEHEIELLCR